MSAQSGLCANASGLYRAEASAQSHLGDVRKGCKNIGHNHESNISTTWEDLMEIQSLIIWLVIGAAGLAIADAVIE